MNIQIIGTRKSDLTRKAERWFSDRHIPYQFTDLGKYRLSAGELENIALRTGKDALLDTESPAYRKKGFAYMEFDVLEELLADQSLLALPVVRMGKNASVGFSPGVWEAWLAAE